MRRLKTFLMAVAAVLFAMPNASAQEMIGSVVEPSEITDGLQVVFEARSGTASKGRYLVPFSFATTPNPARVNSSILEVPDSIVWTLVKATIPNEVTQLDQYYLKNRATGQYLTYQWTESNTVDVSSTAVTLVDDTADARAFCFVRNDDETWKGSYGSVSYGSNTSDWEPTTYTIVNIFPARGGSGIRGGQYGRVFVCNEFEVSSFNLTFFSQYQDTNVWDIRKIIDRSEDSRTALQALIDTYSASVETDYKYGTDPGFIKTEELYNNFYETYTYALENLETMTEEECQTTFDQLFEAKNIVDNDTSVVQIEDGGYYYIKTANDAFTSTDNGNYGMYAPLDATHIGWKAVVDNDNQFIWQINYAPDSTDTERMYYSIRNVGANVYMNRSDSHDNSAQVNFSSTFENRQTCRALNHAGQFNVSSKYDFYDAYPPRPYHQNGHDDGAGTSGSIVLWIGDAGTPSAWFIRKVPQEIIDHMGDYAAKDSLRNIVAEYSTVTSGAEVGTLPGYAHSQQVIDDVDTIMSHASAMLNDGTDHTSAEYQTMLDSVLSKLQAFQSDVMTISDGYYRIRSHMPVYYYNENDIYFAIQNDSTVGWKHLEKSSEYIWKITNLSNGHFTIQNVKNSKYIKSAESMTNGSLVKFSDTPEVDQRMRLLRANGQWSLYNDNDTIMGYDPNGHDNGKGDEGAIQVWNDYGVEAGTSWVLEPISEEDANAIIASEEQNERNILLKQKFEEARRLYNANTNYTLGDAIVTDASQLYANNWSTNEGAHIEYLIDGDKNTFWSSTWESGSEQTPGEVHSLRIYDASGFPDTVQINYVMRQNSSWHRTPLRMRVEVSNDTITWTELPNIISKEDVGGISYLSSLQTDSLHYIVSGIGGYKYVRFKTLCSINNGGGVYLANNHCVYGYSEYNIYPITGIDSNSFTQQPLHKTIADELYAAIQQAKSENGTENATQATIDRLTQAIDQFNQLESNDSLVNMTIYNYSNLTAGDAIGEFPDDALNTYKTGVGQLIEQYQSNPSGFTAEQITQGMAYIRTLYNNLYATMVKPESGKWYVMNVMEPNLVGKVLSAGGNYRHTYGISYSYVLNNKTTDDIDANPGSVWAFTADTTGRYFLQNVGNGGYLGPLTGTGNSTYDYRPIMWYEPKSFTIIPLGNGQIALNDANGYYVRNNASWYSAGLAYEKQDTYENLQDSKYAFTPELASDNHSSLVYNMSSNPGRVIAVTLPYDISNSVSDEDGNDVPAYRLIGKVADEADSLVSGYKLKQISDEVIPAGTPVVYIVPGEYDSSTSISLTFSPVIDSELSVAVDTVNGLRSVEDAWATTEAHLGYFLADSVVDEPINTQIGYQRAVIIPRLVSETGEDADMIVYVQGAGMLNAVEVVKTVDDTKLVNVYTIDGVLVRKNVKPSEATTGLAKGIYIVGKTKQIVK